MQSLRTSTFLRAVLFADAATCIAMGLLMTFGSGALGQLLGLPSALLFYSGIALIPFAMFLVYIARREKLSQAAVWAIIALNVVWTVDSFLLLLTGWVAPTEIGYVFVIAQAVGVAVFASLEYRGLKKSAMATVARGQVS